jgi:ABC-2 type transport system permease protein
MSKIGIIIEKEYLEKVRKTSFLVMTILGPLLFAGLIFITVWINIQDAEDLKIMVVDEKKPVFSMLKGNSQIEFDYVNITLDEAKRLFHHSDYNAILYIPNNVEISNSGILFFKKQPGNLSQRYIESKIESVLESLKLQELNIKREDFLRVKTDFNLKIIKYTKPGEEESVDSEKHYIGLFFGLAIYLFIFLYGMSVMRGVIEEKTNRIVEIIISSAKPFELMMGKIIGIAMVGLTQFLIWIFLTFTIVGIAQFVFFSDLVSAESISSTAGISGELMQQVSSEQEFKQALFDPNNILNRVNFPLMIGLFLFYFLFGYFLYASLFAAVGAAVDNETDTQQFMFPLTIPLLIAYLSSFNIAQNPEGQMAFWLSIIPLTSPVVMLIRVAIGVGEGGVPLWEAILSMALLVSTFILFTWFAAKIFKTGILMYGKKATYKELYKWFKYS